MKVEKRLELALRISESIENGKICPNNLYDLQLHLSDALEQVKKLTIPVVSCTFAMEFAEYVAKEHYRLVNQIGKLHYWKNEKSAKITEQLLRDFEESKK